MSADARGEVWWRLGDVPSAVAVIALALADVANDAHGNLLFASVDTIADKSGRDRRTVQRAFRWLEDAGWMVQIGSRPNGVAEYRWQGPGGGGSPPLGAAPRRRGGGTSPPPGGGDSPPEQKQPKVNRAAPPVDNPVTPSTRFPTNRTADRARCSLCADTGWATNDDGHAFRCTHPAFAERPFVDVDEARRRALGHLSATRERLAVGAAPCPDPITSSSTPPTSPTSPSAPGNASP